MNSARDRELAALLTARPEQLLRAGPVRQAGPLLQTGPLRETFRWTLADGTRAIVKRFAGAARRDVWRARLRGTRLASPGRSEHDALVAMAEIGLPVPRALGWAEHGPTSLVVMEEVEHTETLRELLADRPAAAASFLERVFDIVDRLHGAGWYHRDLYLDHFLLGADGRMLTLIDVGRARRDDAPRLRWFVKDLAALLHSVPPALRGAPHLRFLCRWLDRRGHKKPAVRRRIARAVVAKERRMAAHEPRGGTSFHPQPAAPKQGEEPR